MRWDAGTYGRSFAEVYDAWYGDRGDEGAVVEALAPLWRPGASVLELGVGTGRLAVPLAAAGWEVTGLDASEEMLERLEARCSTAGVEVTALLVDAGATSGEPWPAVTVVLGAYNFLFNLADHAAQLACLRRAAATGARWLVLELHVPDPAMAAGTAEITLANGVRVRTEVDPSTSTVSGVHRGADGVERPWRICFASPEEVDELAATAGWRLDRRVEDWQGSPFDAEGSSTHVSWYRLADA